MVSWTSGRQLDSRLPLSFVLMSQKKQPQRNPEFHRFVYEDRPDWWPDTVSYSNDAIKTMPMTMLENLHRTIISVGGSIK